MRTVSPTQLTHTHSLSHTQDIVLKPRYVQIEILIYSECLVYNDSAPHFASYSRKLLLF